MKSSASRRTFMKEAGVGVATLAASGLYAPVRAADANRRIVLGMIGPGGHGSNLLRSFASQPDVDVAWVCDVDSQRLASAAKAVETARGKAPKTDKDMRRILEDRSVDAVVIATPDHWHAPATLLACEAGKHVYVEKPCAHNLREGRLMVEAARRHNRVVQVGTQSRSSEIVRKAMQLLKDGVIGEVLVAKAWNSQLRANIGKVPPGDPPPHLDFDLWLGPAPAVPYQSNLLPGIWRWRHAFGTGDMGNDGVHEIDIARWGLGVDSHPTRIAAMGGKYFFDDDQEFPDTQYVCFEYAGAGAGRKQLVFEQRIWSPYVQEGHENGNAFYGTRGMMILGKQSGWQIFGPRNQRIDQAEGRTDSGAHHRDFLDAIREGRKPNADIEVGHHSAALTHLGNIATRVGRTLRFDPASESILDDREAHALLRRTYRDGHWAVPRGV
ncbi:MAG: Gfo/Idh/MocA family oxidoreductase [Verrucomicrobiales bacterium]|nr:Gfo/Idh/MocA family oxidoreductase [Verrucomicrobiales bacterium]